jgi:hypothetical protein
LPTWQLVPDRRWPFCYPWRTNAALLGVYLTRVMYA